MLLATYSQAATMLLVTQSGFKQTDRRTDRPELSMGGVDPWVGLGWVGSHKMDPRTTLRPTKANVTSNIRSILALDYFDILKAIRCYLSIVMRYFYSVTGQVISYCRHAQITTRCCVDYTCHEIINYMALTQDPYPQLFARKTIPGAPWSYPENLETLLLLFFLSPRY